MGSSPLGTSPHRRKQKIFQVPDHERSTEANSDKSRAGEGNEEDFQSLFPWFPSVKPNNSKRQMPRSCLGEAMRRRTTWQTGGNDGDAGFGGGIIIICQYQEPTRILYWPAADKKGGLTGF